MNTYRSKWRRLEHLPVEYMQLTTVCLFTLLEDFEAPGSREAFVDLSLIAHAMARRFQLARGMLRLVQLTARHQNLELPEDVQQLYQDFETDWIRAGGAEKFSSSYPNFSLSLRSLAASSSVQNSTSSVPCCAGSDKEQELSASSAELDLFLERWDDALRIDNDNDNDM